MLQLSLLGNPSAAIDGQALAPSLLNKDLALLYYLAASGGPQSRVALAVLLWGDAGEAAARGNLRKSLSDLRQCLGDHLLIERDHVTLARERCTADVWEFEHLSRSGLAASDPAQLQAAADLYRGDFLAGFSVRNAADFDRWLYNEQEQLRSLAVHVLTALADRHASGGELGPAIAALRRVLELEPWREEAHRALMVLLAGGGQRSAALAQYKLCVQVLAAELGVRPSAETTALAEQIGAVAPIQEVSRPRSKPVEERIHSKLPPEPAAIVGRSQELQELSDMLLGPDCRLVTVLGIGGIGKTRLTLALAHRLRAEFAHVAVVSLRTITQSDEILPAIGRGLGLHPGLDEAGVLGLLRDDNPHLLLVLDNFEHLLPAGVEVLEQLLNEAPRLRCVVTSREALSTRWEWRYPLAELGFPADGSADDPAGYGSVQLFLQIARRVRPRPLDGSELRQVIRICRLVGGIPLGIELAAAQTGSLSCAAIADQLAAGVERLAADLRDLPVRQRSLAASFDVSWVALSPQEQNVLARLAVIQGTFTLEAALTIGQAAVADIVHLVDKSLVRSSSGDWYSLHEVIKQQAAGKLARMEGEQAAALVRYRDYLTTWVERNLHRYITFSVWEQEAADQLEKHVQQLWHLWLDSKDQAQRSRIAIALIDAEGRYRSYVGNSAGKLSTWKGLEAFGESYVQVLPAHSGVVVIDHVWLPAVADQLADLTEELAARAESLLPEVVDTGYAGGRLLALPNTVELGLLYYRSDLLRKYGYAAPPATWEELEWMAAAIQAGERAAGRGDFWGFIWPGHKPESLTCTALEWQHAEGGGCIIERDGRISIANEQAAAALTRAARWVGAISPPDFAARSEWETLRAWVEGDAAFMRMWSSAFIGGDPKAADASAAVTILPRGAVRHAATYGGWPLAVHASCGQRKAAIELLKEASSPEVQRLLAQGADARLPVLSALYADPALLTARPLLRDVHQLISAGGLGVRPYQAAGKLYAQVSALYAETVADILHGKTEALPALTKLERSLADLGGWSAG